MLEHINGLTWARISDNRTHHSAHTSILYEGIVSLAIAPRRVHSSDRCAIGSSVDIACVDCVKQIIFLGYAITTVESYHRTLSIIDLTKGFHISPLFVRV